jgi:Uma2 family endonuclease
MGQPAPLTRIEYNAYLQIEQMADQKHQWFDGQVFAMAGGSLSHAALAAAMLGELRTIAQSCGCQVFSSDAKVRVRATGLATYPDGSVVCGELVTDPDDRNAINNPALLVEVLSDSTDGYDRGDKFEHYQKIPSLHDYVLVSQYARRIEVFSRVAENEWTLRVLGPGDAVSLTAMKGTLKVDPIYEGVTLSATPLRIADPRA